MTRVGLDQAREEVHRQSPAPDDVGHRHQHAVVTGDLMHHALQVWEPDWSTIFCWDPVLAAQTRRKFLGSVADTATVVLPLRGGKPIPYPFVPPQE